MLKKKQSSVVAAAWKKMKASVEAKTDPGGKQEYKIEMVRTDPGSEFKGTMTQALEEAQVIHSVGEVDRHADGAVVENRNGKLQEVGTAIAVTACGDNLPLYDQLMQGDIIEWANELMNHTEITKHQKEEGITAWQEQYNTKDTLDTAYGVKPQVFGELCYMYVKAKNRDAVRWLRPHDHETEGQPHKQTGPGY